MCSRLRPIISQLPRCLRRLFCRLRQPRFHWRLQLLPPSQVVCVLWNNTAPWSRATTTDTPSSTGANSPPLTAGQMRLPFAYWLRVLREDRPGRRDAHRSRDSVTLMEVSLNFAIWFSADSGHDLAATGRSGRSGVDGQPLGVLSATPQGHNRVVVIDVSESRHRRGGQRLVVRGLRT